ncbi:MAG: TetR/AcrR family transcriptional regulator [Burkholderiales bacterium]|nr:TetR/AcrR family transcriptional regulator [Burkholderiales bacterium]
MRSPPNAVTHGAPAASGTAARTEDHPTRQRRKEARPQELLDAALELFVEKGFAATRAEEVAQRAGVSKGTLYLYYPSKEELFKAVVRQNLGSLIAEGKEAVAQFAGRSADLLVELMLTWWERIGRTRAAGIHKIIIAEVRNFPELAQFYADEVIVPADELFCAVVQRGVTSGEFRDLPLHETAQALMAPMIFLALHQHSVGACPMQGCATLDPESMLRTHLDLVLHGLQTRAAAADETIHRATQAAPVTPVAPVAPVAD